MVDQPKIQEPRIELICCCASGPIFLVNGGEMKDMPIKTWSEEWVALKSILAQLTHALGRFFSCQRGFKRFGREIRRLHRFKNHHDATLVKKKQ